MTTWFCIIRHRHSGKVAGGALVSLEARYIACCYFNAPKLDRRFAPSALWQEIRLSFAMGLPPTPLPSSEALVCVLLSDKIARSRFKTTRQIRRVSRCDAVFRRPHSPRPHRVGRPITRRREVDCYARRRVG